MSEGRYADDKVCIAAAWRAMTEQPICAGMTLDRFKFYLIAAKRKNLITMCRAEIGSTTPDGELRESEIRYLTTLFHLIVVPR